MSGLEERIRHYFHHLTNGQKRVAKYLLDHPEELAVRSAAEIGKAAGVSETTVIRFCHALEYNGYADLQKQIRRGLIQPKSSLEQYRASKQNLAEHPHFYAHRAVPLITDDLPSIKKRAASGSPFDPTL